jgi:hypothetical protein
MDCLETYKTMKLYETTRERMPQIFDSLNLFQPLYRGLHGKTQSTFTTDGLLHPQSGSLSVGTGVFFTNRLEYAMEFMDDILVVSSQKNLDPENKVIDTRVSGYDIPFKIQLERTHGTYTGFQLWDEIMKKDTITYEGGPPGTFVFTHRKSLTKKSLIAAFVCDKQ